MNVEAIGTWAGLVWTRLNEAKGSLNIRELRRVTKLREKEVYAAVGWLAREGKINVNENEKEVDITLV